MNVPSEFLCHPTVFAIGDTYQIITPVKSEMLFWVKIGDKKYFATTQNESMLLKYLFKGGVR